MQYTKNANEATNAALFTLPPMSQVLSNCLLTNGAVTEVKRPLDVIETQSVEINGTRLPWPVSSSRLTYITERASGTS